MEFILEFIQKYPELIAFIVVFLFVAVCFRIAIYSIERGDSGSTRSGGSKPLPIG